MARGKLTQNEKYIIEGMKKDGISAADIASNIGRAQKTVQRHLDSTVQQAKPIAKKKQKTTEAKQVTAKDLIVNKTVGKGESGVAIMTEAASSRGDESRERGAPSRLSNGAIQKIYPDE